jgi:hypothetical protein
MSTCCFILKLWLASVPKDTLALSDQWKNTRHPKDLVHFPATHTSPNQGARHLLQGRVSYRQAWPGDWPHPRASPGGGREERVLPCEGPGWLYRQLFPNYSTQTSTSFPRTQKEPDGSIVTHVALWSLAWEWGVRERGRPSPESKCGGSADFSEGPEHYFRARRNHS